MPFQRVTSSKVDVTYCNPAFLGDRLRASGTALSDDGKIAIAEVKVHRIRDDKLICFGRQIVAILGPMDMVDLGKL